MYPYLYTRRRYNTKVQTFKIRVRKGDRDVSVQSLAWSLTKFILRGCSRYAYFKKLDYFSTECIYSPDAYRGHARTFLKDLEAARPSAIIDIIHSGEAFELAEEVKLKEQRNLNSY
jgi:hypothetical protein